MAKTAVVLVVLASLLVMVDTQISEANLLLLCATSLSENGPWLPPWGDFSLSNSDKRDHSIFGKGSLQLWLVPPPSNIRPPQAILSTFNEP